MLELSEEGLRIVEALVKAPVAWQSPAELASTMGLGIEATTDLLAFLDADGWLSAWEREFDVVVTLSVEGASRLGVRLVEFGRDEVPRWAGLGEPEPPRPKASGVFRSERAACLELVVDPSESPEEAAERAEEALNRWSIPSDPREKAFVDGLPGPTLLLGTGLSPWPGPGDGRKASCPSCGSKRLKPTMYCLYCDRWGLDHLLRDEPPARPRAPRGPRDEAGRREVEREARKAKRRARRLARSSSRPVPKPGPRRSLI
jgi:hypothetical protein